MRILLIEDEKRIAGFVERGLKEQCFAVDVAHTGTEGLFLAEVNPYDIILLDVMLPEMDGYTVCKNLRSNSVATPILMLTARDSVKDRISGLDAGADDYLGKPFAFGELLARIRALLRRTQGVKTTVLNVGDLELNQLTQKVHRSGQQITLTPKEFNLLEYLMTSADQVVTRTMISEHVWKENFDSFTNVIDVHIKFLRDKIDKDFSNKLIKTRRGVGYILTNED